MKTNGNCNIQKGTEMNTAAKKVIVVFKTHLDIGFTGLAQQVLDKYCLDFIPSAVIQAEIHLNVIVR